jgi:hypothetical protein
MGRANWRFPGFSAERPEVSNCLKLILQKRLVLVNCRGKLLDCSYSKKYGRDYSVD